MDVCAGVVADEQPFELVEPGEGSLDHPAGASEPGAVLGLASCDLGLDPALPGSSAVRGQRAGPFISVRALRPYEPSVTS